MAGGGSSESNSTDMTPQAFQGLQGPYAAVLGNLMGYNLMNGSGQVNPVNFGYPGGQTAIGSGTPTGGGNTGTPTGGGQQQYSGGNGPHSPNYGYPQPAQQQQQSSPSNPLGGMYLSNPNLGTGNPNNILNNIPSYQGQMTAPMSSNESSILQQLQANGGAGGIGSTTDNLTNGYLQGQMLGNYMPGPQQSLGSFSQQYSAAQPQFNANSSNPFLSAAITAAQTPTMQNLQETLGQQLPSQFAQAGQMVQPGGSSAFDRAGDIAIRGAATDMSNIASTLSNQFYGQQAQNQATSDLQNNQNTNAAMQQLLGNQFTGQQNAENRQLTAAQTAPSVTSTQVSNMVQNLQAQALPRLIQQYGIENGLSQFNNQTNDLLNVLGIAGGVTHPTIGQSSSSEQKPNLLPLAGM